MKNPPSMTGDSLRVGALAVVRVLLATRAALAAGLAHGSSSWRVCSVSHKGSIEPREEPLAVDHDPLDLARREHVALVVVRHDLETDQPAVPVDDGGSHRHFGAD